MRKIGGVLLGIGLAILTGWGIYWFFNLAFPKLPLVVKIGTVAAAIGLIALLASLARERLKALKEEENKFKEIEK